MSLYRRVSIRMWGDEKYLALSKPRPNARYLFIFLFTGPHTISIPGLFSAGERQLAESLEWSLKAFRRHFSEIAAHGMATADWPHRVVYLHRAKFHNPPTNSNIIRGWASAFNDLPDCPLVESAWEDFKAYGLGEGMTEAFREAFAKAFAHRFRNSIGIGRASASASASASAALSVDNSRQGPHGSSHGSDALTSSRGEDRPRPSKDDMLDVLAHSNGLSRDELKAQTDALAASKRRRS